MPVLFYIDSTTFLIVAFYSIEVYSWASVPDAQSRYSLPKDNPDAEETLHNKAHCRYCIHKCDDS